MATIAHKGAEKTAAERWRAAGRAVRAAPDARAVAQRRQALSRWLAEEVPGHVPHTSGGGFAAHLHGVADVLLGWTADGASDAADVLPAAGLLHSVYGTEGFQGTKLPFTRRAEVRDVAGARAERLIWAFCVADRLSVDELVAEDLATGADREQYTFRARVELGAFPVTLECAEWKDFVKLQLADWLEQVETAALTENELYGWSVGDAWGYRRDAYALMAQLLSSDRIGLPCASEMHAEVYSRESDATRHIKQPVTPPQSDAAREAREALASAQL